MPNEPQRPAMTPDPGPIVRRAVKSGVHHGLSGREASEFTWGMVQAIREALYTAINGNGASTNDVKLWLTWLLDEAGKAVRDNKTT